MVTDTHKAVDKVIKRIEKGNLLSKDATELAKRENEWYGELRPMGIDVTEGDVKIVYIANASEYAIQLQRAMEEELWKGFGIKAHVNTQR